jgi:hypothetical protein
MRKLHSIALAASLVLSLAIAPGAQAKVVSVNVSATANYTRLDTSNLFLPLKSKKSKYMTKREAAQHYLSLVCPVNASIAAWSAVPAFGPEYDAAVQEIIRTKTEAANGFKNPPKKWPKNIKKAWVTWFSDHYAMEAWAQQMYVGATEETRPYIDAGFDTYALEWLVAKKRYAAYRDWYMNPYWEWQAVYPNLFRKKLGLPPAQGGNNGCP